MLTPIVDLMWGLFSSIKILLIKILNCFWRVCDFWFKYNFFPMMFVVELLDKIIQGVSK